MTISQPSKRTVQLKTKSNLAVAKGTPLLKNGLFDLTTAKPFKNKDWSSHIGSKRKWKSLKSMAHQTDRLSSPWNTLEALPSLIPTHKYCDITGLETRYTDPKTKLYYSSVETYQLIKKLGPTQVQDYLALRNASVQMK